MLTESRKRQRGADEGDGQVPQAKRPSGAHPLSPEPRRDAWDSESSNTSESSGINSPEDVVGSCSSQCAVDGVGSHSAPGPCSPLNLTHSLESAGPTSLVSYHQINRILREAHFQSLQSRSQLRDT